MLMDERFKRMKDLRPFSLLLNQDDLDDCDWLEHAAFEPHEAASREKVREAPVCIRPVHFPRARTLPSFPSNLPIHTYIHVSA